MALWQEFVGGTYQALSPTFAADQAVNVYAETRDVPGSAKQMTLYGTPGLSLETTLATVRCRGWYSQDGRTWVVTGGTLYERTAAGTYVSRGSIADDGAPVSFVSNGQGGDQLGIVGGGELKVLDLTTDVLSSAVALPFVGPVQATFLDGYTLINQADSPIVWFSALEDMTSWDALDFFARSRTADNVVGLASLRDRVWIWGTQTLTLYYNSGDADTPFIPYPGTSTQIGLVSPWLLQIYADVAYWVAENAKGERRVVQASEPTPQHISTPPIDRWLSRCTTLADAESLFYAQEGHPFFVITAPSSPDDVQTFAFDAREQRWHARGGWNTVTGRYTRWRAAGSTANAGTVLVGDCASGAVYTLDLDTYADNGVTLRRERTAPYLSAEDQWLFLEQFELGMQPGVGLVTGQGSDPQVELQVSRDGGRTWTSAGFAGTGAMGAYTARAIWRRLGRARGDRLVLRVVQSDPVKTAWTGAWVRATPGTGQL